ncbi:hypothetical protein A4E84_19045 [Streptomyces qaidamensis]|uniref:Uncharacterized protein n=1 Tax=Streptomyces qaidamensis TaxID=1783515 RepID=A0A143C311_9ACTN|nr:hypothetical protein [Streptomyces qaidamensis]AMW11415.1 hypothetical protein A4E84_19045 [Streptomyces qaidamensis]
MTVSTATPGTDDMARIVQKFVDLVDVSPDFQVTIATRTYSHVERAHRVAAARLFASRRPAGAFLMPGGRMAWGRGATRMARRPESNAQAAIRPTQSIVHSLAAPWAAKRTFEH